MPRLFMRKILLAAAIALITGAPVLAQQGSNKLLRMFELSPAQEKQIAEEEHPKILAQFGGEYNNPVMKQYLDGMVAYLGKLSDRPDIQYRLTVLNSPVVNAFALPAGRIYITRGLLALADNEAEVVGVLAHEMGHVTARHASQRYARASASSLGVGVLGVLGQVLQGTELGGLAGALGQAAQTGAVLYIQGYSRDQEFEADSLGVKTLSKTSYDPRAMASFLTKLQAYTSLQAQIMGQSDTSNQVNLLATHPRTADRIERAIQQAGGVTGQRQLGREPYIQRLEGLLYEDDPDQGYVRGTKFYHPKMRFFFEVPTGFSLINGVTEVMAVGPSQKELIQFDAETKQFSGPMTDYLRTSWNNQQAPLRNLEQFSVNGMEAATAMVTVAQQDGSRRDVRLVAIRGDGNMMYRFLFITDPASTQKYAEAFRRTALSFRRLTDAEMATLHPLEIHVHQVQSGDTIDSLAVGFPYDRLKRERFMVLNGLSGTNATIKPGQLVKLVQERRS
ncbi:MAG: M48 family metalloprotease [Alphaproteobacteria bacterium]